MEWSAEHNRYIDPTQPPVSGSPWKPTAKRLIVFALVFAALQFSWQALRGSAVEHALIHHVTVRPAVLLINALTPNVNSRAVEFSVRATGGGINIRNGCEGLEALFLLAAAFTVAPLTLKSRLAGVALGIVVVFAVNQVRILALFYAHRHDPSLFYPLHATVAPIAVILCVAGFFYWWLLRDRRGAQAH
jgi:exosortase family protein XrtM